MNLFFKGKINETHKINETRHVNVAGSISTLSLELVHEAVNVCERSNCPFGTEKKNFQAKQGK